MYILNDHNFKCNISSLNVFTLFCLKTKPRKSLLPSDSNARVTHECICHAAPLPTVFHRGYDTVAKAEAFYCLGSKNELGRETFLPVGVIHVFTLTPYTQHDTTIARTPHHRQVCLPKHPRVSFQGGWLPFLLSLEKHELTHTDSGTDSLRKSQLGYRLLF